MWRSLIFNENALFPCAGKAAHSELGLQCLTAISETPQTRVWKLPPFKVYSSQWRNTSPSVGLFWKATLNISPHKPLLCLGANDLLSCPILFALFVCRWYLPLERHTKLVILGREVIFAMKMPSLHSLHKWGAGPRELGQSVPDENHTNTTKQESGSFLLAMYILLSERRTAPMQICSTKQHLPFSHR